MATSKLNRKYGWKHDLPDSRDRVLKFARADFPKRLPTSIDLTKFCPPVYDQGTLGSCTGQAIAGAIEYCLIKQAEMPDFSPSRLFIYYNERELEGTINEDAGAMIRDGIKVVNKFGVCPEPMWPYNISKFTMRPPVECYQAALKDRVVEYARVPQGLMSLKMCLASGFPIVFGITIYSSFESDVVAKTGVVPMPSSNEECLGGHAVLCVGYNDTTKKFIVRNSWGAGWGRHGYFTLPYAFMTNPHLSSDFWAIKLMGADVSVKIEKPVIEPVVNHIQHRSESRVFNKGPLVVEKKVAQEHVASEASMVDANLKLDAKK